MHEPAGIALVLHDRGLEAPVRQALGRLRPDVLGEPGDAAPRSIVLMDEAAIARMLPGGIGGLLDVRPDLTVVVLAAGRAAADGTRWLDEGAADCLPATDEHLLQLPLVISRAERGRRMRSENERLHHDLARSLVELELKNQELEGLVDRLEQAARTDAVTRLANRRWLDATLEGTWVESVEDGLPLAMLMIDLDGFKRLNDHHGHQRGDEMLRLVARVLQGNCRASDTVARYGGDEFCVLLPQTHPDEAMTVARRIIDVFLEVVGALEAEGVVIGMSVGIAHCELSRPRSAAELLAHADEAMYAAKGRGPNRYAVRHEDEIEVLLGAAANGATVRAVVQAMRATG